MQVQIIHFLWHELSFLLTLRYLMLHLLLSCCFLLRRHKSCISGDTYKASLDRTLYNITHREQALADGGGKKTSFHQQQNPAHKAIITHCHFSVYSFIVAVHYKSHNLSLKTS